MHQPNVQIRRAREADLPEMARIHYAAFPGAQLTLEERIRHFREDPRLRLEDHWVCHRGSAMAGIFALYDFRTFRRGKALPVCGIGGVAISPEARKSRIAYLMMARALEIMEQNGTPLSILYPFRHSFYRRLGWGLVGQVKLYYADPAAIPLFQERQQVFPVLTAEQQEEVMECYRRAAESGNGFLERPDPVWYERVFKNSQCYAWRSPDSSSVDGYLTFTYQPAPPEQSFVTSELKVLDFVWTSHEALRGLLGFVAAQRDQVRIVHIPDQSGVELEHAFHDPRMPDGVHTWSLGAETARIGWGLMGRIIGLRRTLAAGGFGAGEGYVTFNITDELNPKNNEPLSVLFKNGAAEFVVKPGGAPQATLECGIAALSSIYWGALSLPTAVALNLAKVTGSVELLSGLFQIPKPVCHDRF